MAEKKVSKTFDGENSDIMNFEFHQTGEKVSVNINDIPADIISRLAMHGLSQKLGDCYAGADDGEHYGRFAAVLKDLTEGNWSTRVASGSPRTTQLAEALAAATGKTLEEAAAKLETLDEDAKKGLRAHPQIKVELANIKARKAQESAVKAQKEAGDAPALEI